VVKRQAIFFGVLMEQPELVIVDPPGHYVFSSCSPDRAR
jgi:hypothetical protein